MVTFVNDKKIKLLLVLLGIALFASFLSWSEHTSFADYDNDGVIDSVDNCPTESNLDQADFDSDKLGDACDIDDDNDGVFDALDAFDLDSLDWADFDFDGVGSSKDPDDDNDGILDYEDSDPVLASEDLAEHHLQEIQTCAEMDNGALRLVCYSQFFGSLAENESNSSDALELSIALAKIGVIDDCHFVSHEIGHVAFTKNQNVVKSLQGMDGTMCRGGYFHGVLASYFHSIEETGEAFPDSYNTICDDLIGSSNYQDCVHGLGHGFVHYFGDDLKSSLELCHDLSFYQNILCVKGVMMQYTENVLTRDGISTDVISNLCNSEQLERNDYVECSMSSGTTLAFFTSHDFKKGKEYCSMIKDPDAVNYCIEGLQLEIQDSDKYESSPLTEDTREKFQPQFLKEYSKFIDIRSPSTISNFKYLQNVGVISFSIDKPHYVIMYIPSEFISQKMIVTLNGKIPTDLKSQDYILGKEMVMIRFVATEAGTVLISPVS